LYFHDFKIFAIIALDLKESRFQRAWCLQQQHVRGRHNIRLVVSSYFVLACTSLLRAGGVSQADPGFF